MANIDPAPSWANIRRLETTDINMAGPGGILNDPITSIAARLNLLRDNDTTLGNSVASVNSRQDSTDAAIATIQGQVLNAPGTLSDLENGATLDPAAAFPDVPSVENSLGPVDAINESINSLTARTKQLREEKAALVDLASAQGATMIGLRDGGTVQDLANFAGGVSSSAGVVGDGLSDNASAIEELLAHYTQVTLVANEGSIIGLSRVLYVPSGRTLVISPGVSLKQLATGGNAADAVVRLHAGARLMNFGVLDGGLEERDGSGELTTGVFGLHILNASSCYAHLGRVVNVGAVESRRDPDNANGGGVLIEMRLDAEEDVHSNLVELGFVDAPFSAFLVRIVSSFINVQESEQPFYVQHNVVRSVFGSGGVKNTVEVAGPNTRFNCVDEVQSYNPTGQASFECDFGAYENTLRNCRVICDATHVFPIAHSVQGQVTSDIGDGKLKITRDNTFEDCGLVGGQVASASVFGVQSARGGLRGTFVRPSLDKVSKAPGATGRVVGWVVESTLADHAGSSVHNPTWRGLDWLFSIYGLLTAGDIRLVGGCVQLNESGFSTAGVGSVVSVSNCRIESTVTVLPTTARSNVLFDNCTFVGQVETTLQGQNSSDFLLRVANCVFLCGTTAGVPIAPSRGTLLNLGGHYFTARLPGSLFSGDSGRVVNVFASAFAGILQDAAITQRVNTSHVKRADRPSVGTWMQGDSWTKLSIPAGESGGEFVAVSGTYGALSGVTGSVAKGSNTLVLSSVSGVNVGDWLVVGGSYVSRVRAISGSTATMVSNASADFTSATVNFRTPVWRALPVVGS